MAVEIPYRRQLEFEYGKAEVLSPGIRRVIANNPGPFTFHGTGTYVLGEGSVAVIDPGPDDPRHIEALLDGLGAERVSHIFITHCHHDHSPGARMLQAETGAPTYAFGPHGAGRLGDQGESEEGADWDFTPDHRVTDGQIIEGEGWSVECVYTPGHTSNHMAFALREEKTLFSGDHVMGWSTSVISPPDGDMAAYMASLEKLLDRDDVRYWPTHGPSIEDPKTHVRAFIAHRQARAQQIIDALASGLTQVSAMVPKMYADVSPNLHPAATRSVLAAVAYLEDRGKLTVAGPLNADAVLTLR